MTGPHHLLIGMAALTSIALGCKAKTDEFYAGVFPCTDANQCGTTRGGKPMTCVSAASLGGSQFCAEACDPKDTSTVPAGFVCAASGALLQECTPNTDAGAETTVTSCPTGLSCYRTSLLENRGVCLSLQTCSANDECGTGMKCASSVVKEQLPVSLRSKVTADHLHCLRHECKSSGMSCPTGQFCIGNVLSFSKEIDNLCAPACDSNADCPPNFSCLRNPESAPDAPRLCFPGVVGSRCATAQNCLIGACTDVGVEFNVCSVPCSDDYQCKTLNTSSDVFVCANHHCVTQRPFQGANCSPNGGGGAVCPSGLECFGESPYGGLLTHGECRVPCDANHKCPSRGGIPHICLGADHNGGCYPSNFGMPCETQADCVADFKCTLAGKDSRSNTDYSPRICTMECADDAACEGNTWTKNMGFCSEEHICRLRAGLEFPCERDGHCISGRCFKEKCVTPL